MKRTVLSALTLAALLVSACTPPAPGTTAGPAPAQQAPAETRDEKQVLNVAVGSITANMTPQAAGGHWIRWHLYDTLTQFAPGFEIKPATAAKWDLSSDGLTWTFAVRRDMTFSNGDPVTVDDIIYSLNTVFRLNWPVRANFASIVPESVKKVDEGTFSFSTRTPDVTIVASTPLLFIIPMKYFEQVGFDGFVQKPIGSSPYEISDYKADTQVAFKKRAASHPFRKVENSEIIFRSVPDSGQQVNGLRTGELDLLIVNTFTPDQLDAIDRAGGTTKFFKISTLSFFFPQGALDARNSPLKDKRVRQALNYAVDRNAITKLFREAEAVGQYAIPESPFFDPNIKPYPYDPAIAKKLLAEAGYSNGFKVQSGIEFPVFTIKPEITLAVQANLRDIGVEAEPIPLDFVQAATKGAGRDNTTKAEIFGSVAGDTNGFVSGIRQNVGCGKPIGSPASALWYCNPEFDRLMDQAYAERDRQRQISLMRQAQKVLMDDVPVMPIIVQPSHSSWSSKVKGVQMDYFFYFNLDSAYKVK